MPSSGTWYFEVVGVPDAMRDDDVTGWAIDLDNLRVWKLRGDTWGI